MAEPKIIALAGFAGCGKTTAARLIGWHVASFAAELKRRVDPLFPPGTPKPTKRDTYVAYGVAMRSLDPDYWVKAVRLPEMVEWYGRVVLDDARYSNECRAVRALGGVVVRIIKPGVVAANEEEEGSLAVLSSYYPDLLRVVNDGTPEQLAARVLSAACGAATEPADFADFTCT